MFRIVLLFVFFSLFTVLIMPPIHAIVPLDRASVSSPRLVNAFGNQVTEHLNVNQQVQITADITNNQEITQDFVYIVQVKDGEGVIIHLVWFKGQFESGQKFSPAISWAADSSGAFVAEIFVWESLTNQDALSEPVFINITAS